MSNVKLLQEAQHEVQNCLVSLNSNLAKCSRRMSHNKAAQPDKSQQHEVIQLDKEQYLPRHQEQTQLETGSQTTVRSSHGQAEVNASSRQDNSISAAECSLGARPLT